MLIQKKLEMLLKYNLIDKKIYEILKYYEQDYQRILSSDIDELKNSPSIHLIEPLISQGKLLITYLDIQINNISDLNSREQKIIASEWRNVRAEVAQIKNEMIEIFQTKLLPRLDNSAILSSLTELKWTLKTYLPYMPIKQPLARMNKEAILKVIVYLDNFIEQSDAGYFSLEAYKAGRSGKNYLSHFILPNMMATDVLHDDGSYLLFSALESTLRWLDAAHKRLQVNKPLAASEPMTSSSSTPFISTTDIPRPHSSHALVSTSGIWGKSEVIPRSSTAPLPNTSYTAVKTSIQHPRVAELRRSPW